MAYSNAEIFGEGQRLVSPAKTSPGVADVSVIARDAFTTEFFERHDLPMAPMVTSLLENSDDCIKLIDGEGRLELMNCNGRAAMEVDDMSLIAGQLWTSLWPDEARPLIDDALANARAGKRSRFEAFCPTAKGSPRWWEVTVSPVSGRSGGVEWVLASSRDISERVTRVEQLETLAFEMRHRLRNAFAVSSGVIGAMARALPDHARFAKDVVTRLTQLATVHAGLMDHGGQMQLDDLLRRVLLIDSENRLVQLGSIPDLAVNESVAKALALVIGELATNSMKYGALGNGGRIVIEAACEQHELVLEWHERDGSAAAASQSVSSGQGSHLKQRMLASIGGSLQSEERPDGYYARITVPLSAEDG